MIDLTKQNIKQEEKTNYDSLPIGTKDGKIHFGYLYPSNEKLNSVSSVAAVHLQAFHSLHYMSMIKTGPMQGSTINRCPGPFQIISATDHAGKLGDNKGIGCFIRAENGDIVISAPNGRVRIDALDVNIRADGPDNTRGSINIESNQSINLISPTLKVEAPLGVTMFSANKISIIARGVLDMAAPFINGLSAISSIRPAKIF